MPELTLLQKLEIENTNEWKVLLTNDTAIMGSVLINGLVKLISRKTGIAQDRIKEHLNETLAE